MSAASLQFVAAMILTAFGVQFGFHSIAAVGVLLALDYFTQRRREP